jgi:hypothetical protein
VSRRTTRRPIPFSTSNNIEVCFSLCYVCDLFDHLHGGVLVKQGYRLIIVDKDGVLVSEFQLTENALAQPETFVEALTQSIDDIEEEEI